MNDAQRFLAEDLYTIFVNRVQAMLSYDGLKRSSMFPYDQDEGLKCKFDELGIHGQLEKFDSGYKAGGHYVCFVARDGETLEGVVDTFFQLYSMSNVPIEQRRRIWYDDFLPLSHELGLLLGYLPSAVDDYICSVGNPDFKIERRNERRSLRMLMPGMLSEKNFDESRDLALKWEEHILENYPLFWIDYILECC
jgi:hypothetical protein